ncbi:MAG: tRNA pseudouridine(55) synthase TruB [Gammaproteobacteria bacterium]|nr:tRNA pseudouridine(55) synthase TruB [Gammaproteobacteria bacterium]
MSRRNKQFRDVHGILLFDKPKGPSSNQALQKVKRLYHARKAGHTGSLDPLADGLLIICFGAATKVTSFLLESDKRYITVCKLGIDTATADSEGEIIRKRPVGRLSDHRIDSALNRFRGEIEQIPPMYSALKYKGKRLYQLARDGVEVEREPRRAYIKQLQLIDKTNDTLTLEIACSKGTYVRTLVEDIGEALGCGAHVSALRRTGTGPYQDPSMVTMQRLIDVAEQGHEAMEQLLKPVDSALYGQPAVQLTGDMTFYIKSGQAVLVPSAPVMGYVRLYDEHEAFVGVGAILDDGRVAPKRLIFP